MGTAEGRSNIQVQIEHLWFWEVVDPDLMEWCAKLAELLHSARACIHHVVLDDPPQILYGLELEEVAEVSNVESIQQQWGGGGDGDRV
eukprot:2095822-Rhodomonas_salina.1